MAIVAEDFTANLADDSQLLSALVTSLINNLEVCNRQQKSDAPRLVEKVFHEKTIAVINQFVAGVIQSGNICKHQLASIFLCYDFEMR